MTFQSTSFMPEPETPALLKDLARLFRQVGVQSVRASVVDMRSMSFQASWTITDEGDIAAGPLERTMDSVFPGASTTIMQLAQSALDQTLAQKLSPRLWAFAWRLDPGHAVVAEAYYRDRRDAVGEIDTSLVRLVCSASIRASQAAQAGPGSMAPAPMDDSMVWPQVERRAAPKPALGSMLAAVLAALAAGLALWLATVSLPQAREAAAQLQQQVDKQRTMSESTLTQGLSTAMATGDYGEAQNELTRFATLGYFQSALILNTKGRIVAMAGPLERMRIGDGVTPEFAGMARTIKLSLGTESHGQLMLTASQAVVAAGGGQATWLAGGAAAAALAAAGLLLLQRLGSRR